MDKQTNKQTKRILLTPIRLVHEIDKIELRDSVQDDDPNFVCAQNGR